MGRGTPEGSTSLKKTGEEKPQPTPQAQSRWECELPSFPFLLGPGGEDTGPGIRRHCPPATINQPFILPLQSRESKSKRDKSACPTKDSEPRRKAGRVVGEGEAEGKSWGPNKSPNQPSQGSDEGETGQVERSHVDTRQFSSQEGTGKKKMKH